MRGLLNWFLLYLLNDNLSRCLNNYCLGYQRFVSALRLPGCVFCSLWRLIANMDTYAAMLLNDALVDFLMMRLLWLTGVWYTGRSLGNRNGVLGRILSIFIRCYIRRFFISCLQNYSFLGF